jgi:ketosteroid isomerase-like protein
VSESVEAIARKAYDALTQGFHSGQWDGFFDLFGPEVDVILPAPATGRFTGAEGRAKTVEFFSQFTAGAAQLGEIEIIGQTVAADRVIFEDRSKGTVGGEPYEALHCIHIIVKDGKVAGFHEYNRPV